MFDIRVRNLSSPNRMEPIKYPNQSLDNTAIIDQVALSNNDYTSPKRRNNLSIDKSSQNISPIENRKRSLSVKRIKKN